MAVFRAAKQLEASKNPRVTAAAVGESAVPVVRLPPAVQRDADLDAVFVEDPAELAGEPDRVGVHAQVHLRHGRDRRTQNPEGLGHPRRTEQQRFPAVQHEVHGG